MKIWEQTWWPSWIRPTSAVLKFLDVGKWYGWSAAQFNFCGKALFTAIEFLHSATAQNIHRGKTLYDCNFDSLRKHLLVWSIFFAFVLTNYARYITVYLLMLINLEESHPKGNTLLLRNDSVSIDPTFPEAGARLTLQSNRQFKVTRWRHRL